MASELRTLVTFASSRFNMSEPKPYFINECCFGDDVANWLIQELQREGYETDNTPGQEDFGWYLGFKVGDFNHCLVVAHRPGDVIGEGIWIGWFERRCSLLATLFGGRHRGIRPEAVAAVHRILKREPAVRQVRWHVKRDFEAGHEERGVPEP